MGRVSRLSLNSRLTEVQLTHPPTKKSDSALKKPPDDSGGFQNGFISQLCLLTAGRCNSTVVTSAHRPDSDKVSTVTHALDVTVDEHSVPNSVVSTTKGPV